MLKIKTISNVLIKDEDKDKYYFKSSTCGSIGTEEIAKAMAEFNSSFTVADNIGMLKVLESVIVNKLAEGYRVDLPFGSLKVNATGTCKKIEDTFSLANKNNDISVTFAPAENAKEYIRSNLRFVQDNPDSTKACRIYAVKSKQPDLSESGSLVFSAGDMVKLQGVKFTFDYSDDAQGVFLENADSAEKVRILNYSRAGSNIVEFPVPKELKKGTYRITISTKPNKVYYHDTARETIDVK